MDVLRSLPPPLIEPTRKLIKLLRVGFWIAASLLALAVSAIYHAQLPIAYRIVRDTLNAYVTREVKGELVVGRLDKVQLGHIVARHVALFDESGRRVIVADRVDLYPDFGALRSNTLRFKLSRLTNGTMRLIDDGTGTPSWVSALNPTVKGTGGSNPLHAQLDRIEAKNLTVYGEYLGLRGMRVEDIDAVGGLDIKHTVDVRIDSASGTFVRPFDFLGRVDGLHGTISSDPTRSVSLQMQGHRELAEGTQVAETGERVSATITFKAPAPVLPQELRIDVDASELLPDTLRKLGYTWIGPIEMPLNGHVSLFGPPSELAVEGSIDSPAGPAQVNGTISAASGVSVRVSSDGIALDQAVPNMPPVLLRGSLHVSTDPAELDPRVHVALASMRYKGFVVPAFEADGVLKEDGLYIERARSTQGGRLSLKGKISFDGGTDLRIDANLPAVQREPNLSRYVEDLEGQLAAAVRIRIPARGGSIDIDGQVELKNARYTSLTASRVIVSGTARGDPELPALDVEVHGENVRVMKYSLGTAHFALRGGPHAYTAQGEFSPTPGQKTFYFDAQVAATKKQFVIQADPIEFVVGDKTFRGLARDLKVVNGKSVSLGLLRLASGSQRLEASGTLQVKGEANLRADLQNFDLAAVHALLGDDFPLSDGNADATVELHGSMARPEISLQGAMRGARVHGVPDVGALFSLTYAGGDLELDSEVEVAGRGSLNLSGSGRLDAREDPREALIRGRYDLKLAADGFDLTLIAPLRERMVGRISGTVAAKGTLDAPTLKGRVAVGAFGMPGMAPLEVTADLDYDAAELNADIAAADGGGDLAKAQLRAALPWKRLRDDPGRAAAELAGGDWELTGETRARALDQLPFALPGAFSLPLALQSKFQITRQNGDNRGSLEFTANAIEDLHDDHCRLSAKSNLTATAKLNGEKLNAQFEGQLDGKPVLNGRGQIELPLSEWLRGAVPLTITRADMTGKADLEDIEQVPVLCQHGRGDLHVDVQLHALFTPEQHAQVDLVGSLNPHVRILEGRQRQVVESCRDDPARVWAQAKVDAHAATAQGWMEGCYGGHTDIGVNVPLRWMKQGSIPQVDDSRDTRVQLDFAESQLRPLLDRVPGVLGFATTANGQLVAHGNKQRVQYSGTVRLNDGNLYVLATGQELTGLKGTLVGMGDWVRIDGLTAAAANGRIELAGGIGFDRWLPARLQLGLVLRNFAVQREGADLATLNGSAALSTEIKPTTAQTAVKIHALAIGLPDESSRSLQSLDSHPDVLVTTDKPKPQTEKPYAFEFFIDGQRGVSATREDFEVQLATELAVKYEDPVLHVGGYIEFRRGNFEVFGKQFDINRGSLQFDGGTELNPEVNLVATQRPEAAGAARVVAQVGGTLSQPIVDFYSETCPGQGAVVQLVSGRCPTEDDSSRSDASGAQNAFAAGVVGGVLTLGARSQLGGLIPRIAVESTGQGVGTRVKAGFEAVPDFMRPLVQRVYLQGAVSTSNGETEGAATDNGQATADFLIELYFPHNIVGTARVIPRSRSWGLDVTWEP